MTDWATISSLATVGATPLALGTFASVRSANRASRVAERTLQAGLRPVRFAIELLYSDHEGGQRTVTLFSVTPRDAGDDPNQWLCSVARDWNLDRPGPR